jgi:hypothetical protein
MDRGFCAARCSEQRGSACGHARVHMLRRPSYACVWRVESRVHAHARHARTRTPGTGARKWPNSRPSTCPPSLRRLLRKRRATSRPRCRLCEPPRTPCLAPFSSRTFRATHRTRCTPCASLAFMPFWCKHMHVCACVHVHTRTRAYAYTRIHRGKRIHTHAHTSTDADAHTSFYQCTQAYVSSETLSPTPTFHLPHPKQAPISKPLTTLHPTPSTLCHKPYYHQHLFRVLRNPTPHTLPRTPYPAHPTPYPAHPTHVPHTLHPAPHTLHPAPHTLRRTAYTLPLTPYTLHPTPYTQNRRPATSENPYALHPPPYTLHPPPYALNPTPYSLRPTPYTLHPTR